MVGGSDAVAAWTTVGIGSQYGSPPDTAPVPLWWHLWGWDHVRHHRLRRREHVDAQLRPFSDPLTSLAAAVPTQEYFVYPAAYIVAPVKDFRRWLTVYDALQELRLTCKVRGDRKAIPGPGGDPQLTGIHEPG